MNSEEIYSIILSFKVNIPTSRIYFEKILPLYNFQRKDIYTISRKITINPYLRSLQYKILNNVIYLNKKLYFWLVRHTFMFFLLNGKTDLLLHSYPRYLESSSGLFH